MNEQLPISPVTGERSALTAQIRKSVKPGGWEDPAPVATLAGGSTIHYVGNDPAEVEVFKARYMPGSHPLETPGLRQVVRKSVGIQDAPPQQQQAMVQRGPSANDLAQAITTAVVQMLGPALQQLNQAQQAMVQRAAYAPQAPVARSLSSFGPDNARALPTPVQGPQGGPATLYVYNTPARGAAGMANAMLNELRQGPASVGLTTRSYTSEGGRSAREVVRASLGLPT